MYLSPRRKLCCHRVLFLVSGLIICSVHQLLSGDLGLSAPRTAPPSPGQLVTRSRKLLQTTDRGSAKALTPSPGTPSPETPPPGTPAPRTPSPGTPSPGTPSPGTPAPRTPSTGTPSPGPPALRTPSPGTPSPGTPSPGTPAPRTPNPWTSKPGTRTRSAGLTPSSSSRPGGRDSAAASGGPRLKGCIRVGDEIIPAPTATPPGTDSSPAAGASPGAGDWEVPLGHSKGEYPADLFSVEQRRQGWVVLHATGMVYMFIALALVCDEFFVPSLGEIIEKLQISDDVAGATFMAAGGSAPELFTSLIGVFVSHSNVGIGTIVGSAVFNILFVIGMCAIFSREILHLTWWPLFRDVSFYILDLIMLIIFFLDNLIEWWESLLLLSAYISYVCFMKFNTKMERWFKGNIVNNNNVVKVMSLMNSGKGKGSLSEKQSLPNSPAEPNTTQQHPAPTQPEAGTGRDRHIMAKADTELTSMLSIDSEGQEEEKEENNRLKPKAILTRGSSTPSLHNSMLRNTLFQLMINTLDPLAEGGETDEKQKEEIQQEKKEEKEEEKREEREETDLPNVVNVEVTPPTDPSSPSSPTEGAEDEENLIKDQETNDQCEDAGNNDGDENDGSDSDSEDSDEEDDSDEDSDEEDNEEKEEEETHEEEPLSLEWPDTRRKQITYLCLLPIVFPLWLTVPDVRNAASKKYFIGTFFGSILWIGAFSYLMVWWAHQVGETIGISEEIMGLTILAAGTSIPDLITSVIVARKGLGDMAVSSSVGSNIFDITVGLPVPWLLYATFHRFSAVPVSSNGLFCAIVLLFLMLLFVIISIGFSKWKMNKFLGSTMFCLYFTFLIISVMLEDRIIVCPVSI
ncbi:sodium/potassium/calcium exchanger 1 isoform X2 [Stegostoma tigrinum]|uniref:sodium/potassium/calcium exchanger 1 isoform X2 n=1 Tax=Stegostoma tigrinum TaxID=3053191 RepID=UPI00286FD1E0|nr:sodium/potassium/calcium exchanger 1 isoform X2 [Stegostoma tigrinum]